MVCVLLTRPKVFAAPLAERLRAGGYDVCIEPMLKMEPLPQSRPGKATHLVIALTSRLTMLALQERRQECEAFLKAPCYCVGAQTAADAQAFGFTDVRQGSGGALALADLILSSEGETLSVLHIGGVDSIPFFHEKLEKGGRNVVLHWPVYKAEARQTVSPDFAQKMLSNRGPDVALFFSQRTAQTFVDLTLKSGLGACCKRLSAIGLSSAVVEPLGRLPWASLLTADEPSEEAVLSCLSRSFPVV